MADIARSTGCVSRSEAEVPGHCCDAAIPLLPRHLRPGDCFAYGSQCPLLQSVAGSGEGWHFEDEDEEEDG